jgi:hypothetical protein
MSLLTYRPCGKSGVADPTPRQVVSRRKVPAVSWRWSSFSEVLLKTFWGGMKPLDVAGMLACWFDYCRY